MNKNYAEQYLQIVGIEDGNDKVGIPYKTVTFQCKQLLGKKEHSIKGLLTRVFWPKTYNRLVNGIETKFRGDAEFDMLAIGDTFMGRMFQCDTTPYGIGEGPKSITSWKGVIFEGENELVVAAKALRNNNAKPKFYNEDTEEVETFTLTTQSSTTKPQPSLTETVDAGAEGQPQ